MGRAAIWPDAVADRIIVDEVSECWVWTGARNPAGYGIYNRGGGSGTVLVHRFMYARLVGTIPPGLHLDHLCYIRSCCNPAHLEPVTAAENNARARARRTHCRRGHPYSGTNLYVAPDGERQCRTCSRLSRERNQREAE